MVFNETSMFIFCHVTDVTRFPGTKFLTSEDCVDMVIDLAPDFTPGVTDSGTGFGKIETARFRDTSSAMKSHCELSSAILG